MPQPRKLPDNHILLKARYAEGLNLTQIARRYGVAKSTLSAAFARMGHPWGSNAAMNYREILPWAIERKHQPLDAGQRLAAHLRAHAGIAPKRDDERRLRNWYARLHRDSTVLDYQPTNVGTPWVYLPRSPEDGDLLIRWPDGQSMTAEQKSALSFPAGA